MIGTPTSCVLPTRRWGLGNRARVLLVHGVGSSGADWSRVASSVADAGADVVAPDLRGHGAAPAAGRYRFADFAADLAQLGQAWDLIVGHSLGGPIACELVQSGVGAGALLLIDPVFEIPDSDLPTVVADQVAESDPFCDPAAVARANPRWGAEDAFHKACAARQVSGVTIERVFTDNAPWQHAHLLNEIQTPTMILGADPAVFAMFTPELAARMQAERTHLGYSIVPGSGHGVHRERADTVVEAAVSLLGA
jgi:pimeloyl-ACP methyl ester carboxylesterase